MASNANQNSSLNMSGTLEGEITESQKRIIDNETENDEDTSRTCASPSAGETCVEEESRREVPDLSGDQETLSLPLQSLTIDDNITKDEERIEGEVLDTQTSRSDKISNSDDRAANKQLYRLKWIEWHNKRTPIVTQNENGPCPLIAITNILLLRGKIQLRPSMEFITADDLMEYIGDAIMESIPKDLQGGSMLNYQQNMHDAIAILPRLHTGLDVNVKFTGVQHFEYTPECIIFDLLDIPLYHGWLVDPQCQETVEALGNVGYNQLVERIIVNKCSSDSDLVTEALIAEQFLERTASQLTYHGLCELNSAMKRGELAVLFRNNHFSTILKKKVCSDRGDGTTVLPPREDLHELLQLVTDQGFLHEPRVVWETLSNIEGDGQFVDCHFASVPPKAAHCFLPQRSLTEEQQISQDYLVALSLQEEQKKQQERDQTWLEFRDNVTSDLVDEELARRLQCEQPPVRAPSPSASSTGRVPTPAGDRARKGAMCTVI